MFSPLSTTDVDEDSGSHPLNGSTQNRPPPPTNTATNKIADRLAKLRASSNSSTSSSQRYGELPTKNNDGYTAPSLDATTTSVENHSTDDNSNNTPEAAAPFEKAPEFNQSTNMTPMNMGSSTTFEPVTLPPPSYDIETNNNGMYSSSVSATPFLAGQVNDDSGGRYDEDQDYKMSTYFIQFCRDMFTMGTKMCTNLNDFRKTLPTWAQVLIAVVLFFLFIKVLDGI
mmetsp:Transcript_46409/g.68549  ORF Transcript_46409/g.68549 Transcript_46409/m.68549 type:complete len:227 (+) Transcript_46409:45-725(+)